MLQRRVLTNFATRSRKRSIAFNGIEIDPEGDPLELLITPGATGALITSLKPISEALRRSYLSLTILITGTFSMSWEEALRSYRFMVSNWSLTLMNYGLDVES